MIIVNNSISLVPIPSVDFIGVCIMGSTAVLINHSAIRIDNNSLKNLNGEAVVDARYAYVAYLRLYNSTSLGECALSLTLQSTISLSNNVAFNIRQNSFPFYVALISLKGESAVASLDSKSSMVLEGNGIVNSTIMSEAIVSYLYFESTATEDVANRSLGLTLWLNNTSRIVIERNFIVNSTVRFGYTAYIYGNSLCLNISCSLRGHSSISMSQNSFTKTTITASPYVACMNLIVSVGNVGSCVIIADNNGSINLQNNRLQSGSAGGSVYISYVALSSRGSIGGISLLNRSTLAFEHNSLQAFQSNSPLSVAQLSIDGSFAFSSLTLDGGSTVRINNNGADNCSISSTKVAYIYIRSSSTNVGGYVSSAAGIRDRSSIVISNNYLRNSAIGNTMVAYMTLLSTHDCTVALRKVSSILLVNNSISSCFYSGITMVSHFYVQCTLASANASVSLNYRSMLNMSGNSIRNAYNSSLLYPTYAAYMYVVGTIGSSAVSLNNLSNLAMNDNFIQNTATQDACVACVFVVGSIRAKFVLGNQSTFLVHKNSVTSSFTKNSAYIVNFFMNSDMGSASLDLNVQSLFSVSNNSLLNSSVHDSYYNIYLRLQSKYQRNITMNNRSVLSIQGCYSSGNTVGSAMPVYVILHNASVNGEFASLLSLGGQSTFTISNISVQDESGRTDHGMLFILVDGPVVLSSASSFALDNISATKVSGLLVIQATSISASDSSLLALRGSQFSPSSTYPACLLSVSNYHSDLSGVLSLTTGARLEVSDNRVNATGEANIANVTLKTLVDDQSYIRLTQNYVIDSPSRKSLVYFLEGLHLNGSLIAIGNTLAAPNTLVEVEKEYSGGEGVSVNVCDNFISSSSGIFVLDSTLFRRKAFLHKPPEDLMRPCHDTTSITYGPSLTVGAEISPTLLITVSLARGITVAGIPSTSQSARVSATATPTLVFFDSVVPKPVPVAVVATAKQVRDVAGVAVAITAVASVTGGQLGVANAMIRLADCDSADNSDEEALPILVHPLRFSFGNREYQKYAAAALSDTLVVPLIVVTIALGPARLLIMWARSVSSRGALVQIGWPTVLILPFTNLAEGIGVTMVASISSGEPFGIGMGIIALFVLVAFIGSWVWILIRVIPKSRLQLRQEEDPTGFGKRRMFLWRMVRPSHRWMPLSPEDTKGSRIRLADLERYGNAIGDKQWYYAELLSLCCSLLVGVCEGLPTSFCRERAVIALIPSILQCGLAVLALIPLERFLQSLLALCLVPMYVVVAVKVFNGSAADEQLDSILASLSAIGNIIGLAIMALGLAVGLWEIATSHRASRWRQGLSDHHQLATPALAESDDEDQAEASTSEDSDFHLQEPSFLPVDEKTVREREPHDLGEAPATSEVLPKINKQRSIAEVLDFVEQMAISQRLENDL